MSRSIHTTYKDVKGLTKKEVEEQHNDPSSDLAELAKKSSIKKAVLKERKQEKSIHNKLTYRLRFFFDYGCGGCLWPDNKAAYEKFDVGPLDAEIYDLHGNVSQEAKIKLLDSIKKKVLALDKLYSESLNWADPTGESMWNKSQWSNFHTQTRELHKEISNMLGDNFEIIYKQE
jgi:hypothetical protein